MNTPDHRSDLALIMRVLMVMTGAFIGFYGAFLFMLAWPLAAYYGWLFEETSRTAITPRLSWFSLGLYIGQLPLWLVGYSGEFFERYIVWAFLGPAITVLCFLSGVIAYKIRHRARVSGDASPPSHGSSAIPHKRNATEDERRDGNLRLISVHGS